MNTSPDNLSSAELEVLKRIAIGQVVYAQAPHECEGLLLSGLVKKVGGRVTLTREGRSHLTRAKDGAG